jgi:HK97 family phage major capsid protein
MSTKLKEAQDKVRLLSAQALEIAESKTLSFSEQKEKIDPLEADIKKWTDEVQELSTVDDWKKNFASQGLNPDDAGADKGKGEALKSLGRQFVDAKGYQDLKERGFKGGSWNSGEIELKATLTEGTVGTPGGGYQNVNAVPNLLPGIVDIKFRPLTIADLFPQGTTNTPLIRYLVETMATNGAAPVKEGNPKPESALKFDKVDEVLAKIATFLPTTDEMLEDWAQTMSYIDARLLLFVLQAEETQLLRGDGTDGGLVGLLNRSGLATSIAKGSAPSVAGDNAMDAIYRQITQIRTVQFLEPDAVAIDPLGWQNILLSKNSQGAYYANGPFASESASQTLWGKRVAVSPALDATSALVGAFAQAAQIFRKGGLTVEASNSHADFFQRNMTAIRAEERVGLAVYRPGAFGAVTNLV